MAQGWEAMKVPTVRTLQSGFSSEIFSAVDERMARNRVTRYVTREQRYHNLNELFQIVVRKAEASEAQFSHVKLCLEVANMNMTECRTLDALYNKLGLVVSGASQPPEQSNRKRGPVSEQEVMNKAASGVSSGKVSGVAVGPKKRKKNTSKKLTGRR